MLLQLKQALDAGTHVPLTLVFHDAQGQTSRLSLQVPVRALGGHGKDGHGKDGHGHQH